MQRFGIDRKTKLFYDEVIQRVESTPEIERCRYSKDSFIIRVD